jgi:predicted RNA-binding protein YlqC (UPF0109 family)
MTEAAPSETSEQENVEQMQDLVSYLAKALVDYPDQVEVTVVHEERAVVFELLVAPGDLGKVIGRDGRTARALRTVLSAASAKLDRRAVLEILEEDD